MFNRDHNAIVAIKDEKAGTYKFRWLEYGAPFDRFNSEEESVAYLLLNKYNNKRRVKKLLGFGNLERVSYPMIPENVDVSRPAHATIDDQAGWPSIPEMVYKTSAEGIRWYYVFERGHWHICDGRMIVDLKQYLDHDGMSMFSVGETFGL